MEHTTLVELIHDILGFNWFPKHSVSYDEANNPVLFDVLEILLIIPFIIDQLCHKINYGQP